MTMPKEWYRKYAKNRHKWFKNQILQYKFKQGSCQICGWNEHYEVLEFHHKDKSEKKFNMSSGNFHRNWEKVLAEMQKCLLVCPNCHKWIHYNEREWFAEQARKGNPIE